MTRMQWTFLGKLALFSSLFHLPCLFVFVNAKDSYRNLDRFTGEKQKLLGWKKCVVRNLRISSLT